MSTYLFRVWRIFGIALFAATTIAGCALTSKADLVTIRYFSPDGERPKLTAAGSKADNSAVEVRLGRVSSGPHLRERIAYRDAAYEVSYHEDQRWTERPENFVRRSLARTLFEEHGFSRVLGGAAPTLDVEVVAFDEVRRGSGLAARVELRMVLFEDRKVLHEETLIVERPVTASGGASKIEDTVRAMSEALDQASEETATRVQAAVLARAKEPRTDETPAGGGGSLEGAAREGHADERRIDPRKGNHIKEGKP